MDDAQKYITETLTAMSSVEARQAIATRKIYIGEPGSPNHNFALSLVEAKEAEERAAHDSESLSISRKALEISEKARTDVKCANKIAISAMILSIATAIGIAIFQWLTKK
jgi:hypothetical protein